ncbi:TlpA family protein disulfide reductase [Cytophaga aurantiaca]|uniref:TlpA family protein disulfide reductase n=1 Tax=Cytophaga aurantiaca TaxID=29530 RepID=UPI00036256DA|nr:TlpA disulfide reductase family protein [Cytophaga aurantiaca]
MLQLTRISNCFIIIAILSLAFIAARNSEHLVVGAKAPDFKVAALNGVDSISLRDYRGKIVIVHLWSPTCPHCREANKYLPDIMAPYKKANLAYIMISIDMDTTTLRPVIEEDKLNFAIHGYDPFDGSSKIMMDYEAPGTPCINVVDEKGNLLAVNITYVQLKKFLKKHFTA